MVDHARAQHIAVEGFSPFQVRHLDAEVRYTNWRGRSLMSESYCRFIDEPLGHNLAHSLATFRDTLHPCWVVCYDRLGGVFEAFDGRLGLTASRSASSLTDATDDRPLPLLGYLFGPLCTERPKVRTQLTGVGERGDSVVCPFFQANDIGVP
jgi:hypothetical protein